MQTVPKYETAEYGHNLQATPSVLTPGTSITAGATPHVKTAFSSLIDPIPGDTYGFWLYWGGLATSAANTRSLLDLAISETGVGAVAGGIILPNYTVGGASIISQAYGGGCQMYIPLFLPEGKRLSARWQCATASLTLFFAIWLQSSPSGTPPKVWTQADAYGADTATSGGVAITAGNTGAESAWTSLGGTLSRNYEAFIPGHQTGSVTVLNALGYQVEYGFDSTAMMEYWFSIRSEEATTGLRPSAPIYQGAPSGEQMQARAECSGTGQSLDYAIYGLY